MHLYVYIDGVNNNGVTANVACFDRDSCWYCRQLCFPEHARAYLVPIRQTHDFRIGPISVDPMRP